MDKFGTTMGNVQTNVITPIINRITSDDICNNYPNLCNLCDVLGVLTPKLFESTTPVILNPVFKTDLREGTEKPILWNLNIVNAIVRFEKEVSNHQITNMNQIPLVLFINVIKDGLEIFSHSYIMFIISNKEGLKFAYTMGLGQNKNTHNITIRSPDFNPYLKVNNTNSTQKKDIYSCLPFDKNENTYNGKYIIKSVEPLTFQYLRNFNTFLKANISNIEDTKVFRKDIRAKKSKFTETVWTIQTTIPYVKLNLFKGENCASFVQKMSYKTNTKATSICNTIFGMNNPSSTKSVYFNMSELNEFITNVLGQNNDFVVEWLLNIYNQLYPATPTGGQLTRKKYKRTKNKKILHSKKNTYKYKRLI
jgi:hypothetical protein